MSRHTKKTFKPKSDWVFSIEGYFCFVRRFKTL